MHYKCSFPLPATRSEVCFFRCWFFSFTVMESDCVLFSCVLVREMAASLQLAPETLFTSLHLVHEFAPGIDTELVPVEVYAQACVLLATKVQGDVRSLASISMSAAQVKSSRFKCKQSLTSPDVVKEAELRLLLMCGFVVKRERTLQHRHLVWLVEVLLPTEFDKTSLMQPAWAFLNDSLMLDLIEHSSLDIACACLALAAQEIALELPMKPLAWWDAVGASQSEIERIAVKVSNLQETWRDVWE